MGIWNRLIGRPDKGDFAKMMTEVLRGGGESRPINYDEAEFCLVVGDTNRVFLGNIYGDYLRETRGKRKELLAKCATLTKEEDYENLPLAQIKKMLLPRVRERYYHEQIRLMGLAAGGTEKPSTFPTKVLAEHLTVEVAIDLPDKVGVISAEKLAKWGISLDEALAIGRENLWRLSTKSFEQMAPGLYLSNKGDTHDASRMYLHDLVWQHEVKGKHVVMIPNRNVLLLSGSEDEAGLGAMAKMADEMMGQPRAQTAYAFELVDSTWRPFLPKEGSAVRQTFRNLQIISSGRDYGEQKAMLDKVFAKQGKDLFVARPMVMERKVDGSLFTVTTWAEGIEGLITEAEWVGFGKSRGGKPTTAGFGRWERVIKVAGELLHRTEDYPPRYHFNQFPTDEQLAAMDLCLDPP